METKKDTSENKDKNKNNKSEFLIATGNKDKVKEISTILSPLDIKVKPFYEIKKDIFMPDETGMTFKENAEIKADYIYNLTKMATIADDSGLMVDALNGAPGIYSARYAGKDAKNFEKIEKILKEMKGVPKEKRTAKFICTICCILSDGKKIFTTGKCEGIIAEKATGRQGFGYDPIFLTSNGKSFAELSEHEKNEISHRGMALKKLYCILKETLKCKS